MTALRSLFQRVASFEQPQTPISSAALVEWLGGQPLDAGVAVTPSSSMNMSAVWRSVMVTAGVAAALPLHAYKSGTLERVESPMLTDPHPEMTNVEVWQLLHAHRLLWGDGIAQKLRTRAGGPVRELWPVSPWRVQRIARVKPTEANPGGKEFDIIDDAGVLHRDLTTRDIFHVPGFSTDGVRGRSVISHAAQGIGLALAAEKSAARFFGRGAQLSGVLTTEQRLEQDQADALKERWHAKVGGVDNSHEIAVLDSGAKFQTMTMPYRDAQLLESRRFAVAEMARWFGVPLFLLFETERSTSWGTGLEQQAQGWVTFDLYPQHLARVEARVTKELTRPGEYAKYSVQGLLRADSLARAEFYRVMREVGALNADEIRELEDRSPIADGSGQTYLQPANMQPLGTIPPVKQPPLPPPPPGS